MRVEVVLPGVLAEDAGGTRTLLIDVAPDAVVRHVLDALADRYPLLGRRLRDEAGEIRRHVNLFADGEDVRRAGGQEMPLGDGAVLLVLPNVSGG